MHLTEEQETAVLLCVDPTKRVVGVTGQAGTGKTSILKEAYYRCDFETIALCAPTGRAAKRITEATGIPAMTIHRMMRYSMPADEDDESLPAHSADNPLPYMCVFVDESSMVGEDLYRNLVDALPPGGVIRFFGDANQLPPVEGKSPFLNVLDRWPSATLTHVFRSNDGIIAAASSILNGRTPKSNDKFAMVNPGVGNMINAMLEFIDDGYRGMQGQIIIPTKKGKYGTEAVNKYLQRHLNGDSKKKLRLRWEVENSEAIEREYRPGDKIVWTKNDYKLHLMNGQIGWVVDVDEEDGNIYANFDGEEKLIPPLLETYDERRGRSVFNYDPRKNMDLAYAITTHKSQGSEFERIVLLLNRCWPLNRNNFYTAVTRARERVTCIMGPGALMDAMRKAK